MSAYNPYSLDGKRILVTGASSGIGKSVAIECSKMRAILNIVGRDQNRLQDTLQQLNGTKHSLFQADLSSEEEIK